MKMPQIVKYYLGHFLWKENIFLSLKITQRHRIGVKVKVLKTKALNQI